MVFIMNFDPFGNIWADTDLWTEAGSKAVNASV